MELVKALPSDEWGSIMQQIDRDGWHIQSQMPAADLPDGWLDQLDQITVEVIRFSSCQSGHKLVLLHPATGLLLQ
jgi:hypothetical protein